MVLMTDVHEYLEGAYLIPTEPHPVTGKKAPVIIGHEYSGIVSGLGSGVSDLAIGDRVVVQPIIFDGTCNSCQQGLINCCSNSGFIGLSGSSRTLCHADCALSSHVARYWRRVG